MEKYAGYTLEWAHGRLKWAMDALDHIEKNGLIPGDRRPHVLQTDLPAIRYVLGNLADGNSQVCRVRDALKKWHLEEMEA